MAITRSIITITDPAYVHLPANTLSNIHNPRKVGQGYCTVEDVLEGLASRRISALEHYLDDITAGTDPEDAFAKLMPEEQVYFKKIKRWITKWSNYVDDKIRSKYSVPFPDAPYAPQVLNLAATYYVLHALYIFEGGNQGNKEEDGEPTYWDLAEGLLRGILSGETHLETDYTVPITDETGKVIGEETVVVGVGGNVIAQHYTENPMSIANQEREFGPATTSWRGGSGYRQHGLRNAFGGRSTRNEDFD